MRSDQQIRLSDRRIRQRRHRPHTTRIPRLQLSQRTPIQRPRRTRRHTRRSQPLLPIVKTQITLRHMPRLDIELRSRIGARPLTITTTNALRIINKNRAVSTNRHRRRRTHPHTNRILTMITRHRRVIGNTRGEKVSPTTCQEPPENSTTRRQFTPTGVSCLSLQAI